MELNEASDLIWSHRKYVTQDVRQAISHLNEEVAESMKALTRGDVEKARKELEDAFSCLLIAMRVMNVDLEQAVRNQVRSMQMKNRRIMVIKERQVEIWVDGEQKGGWSVWGPEDISQAEKVGKEFGCEVIYDFSHRPAE